MTNETIEFQNLQKSVFIQSLKKFTKSQNKNGVSGVISYHSTYYALLPWKKNSSISYQSDLLHRVQPPLVKNSRGLIQSHILCISPYDQNFPLSFLIQIAPVL